MADDNNDQSGKHLASTDSMAELLNMDNTPTTDSEGNDSNDKPQDTPAAGDLPPHLPFLETLEEPPKNVVEEMQAPPESPSGSAGPAAQLLGPATEKGNEGYAFALWLGKSFLPYIAVFLIAIGLYVFYFSDWSFTNIFHTNSITLEKVTSKASNKDLEKLKSDQETAYKQWMSQFFFAVNDDAIVSMDTDVSGNGLTNFEKYLLDLNPKVYSTRGTNQPDGQLVIEGTNPWTGKPFTDKQKDLVDKYINKEDISNRITAAALSKGENKFAQYVSKDSPYYVTDASASSSTNATSSEVANNEVAYNTAQQVASTTQANLNPSQDIDQSKPGKIDISANNISVPLTWTQDVKNFDADLKKGTVHYPGTALPGQMGTSYISGHSSGYIWDNSPYKTIFAGLGQVNDGTSFTITATRKDGHQVIFHYVVVGRGEYQANDQAQFANTADSVVALSTCWPVGTTARRLVVYGKLTQTEQN